MGRDLFFPTSLSGNTITIPNSVYSLDAVSILDCQPNSLAIRSDATNLRFDVFVFDINSSDAHDGEDNIRPYDFSSSGFGVWKRMTSPLDAFAPKIISGAPLLGDIRGGDATISANTITFQPCSCLNSTGSVQLYTDVADTCVLPSLAGNYHIFLVKLIADSSFEWRAYTSEAAVISDTDVSAYRYRTWWPVLSTNVAAIGWLVGDELELDIQDGIVISTNPSTTAFVPTWATYIPSSRIQKVGLWGKTGSGGTPNFAFALAGSSGNGSRAVSIANYGAYGAANAVGSDYLWVNLNQKIKGVTSLNTGTILAAAFKLWI